jgi:hypothetical protein
MLSPPSAHASAFDPGRARLTNDGSPATCSHTLRSRGLRGPYLGSGNSVALPLILASRGQPGSNPQVLVNAETIHVLYKGMSRENSSPSTRCRSFFGIQPNRVKEWSSSGRFCLPVVPFRCCDGAHRFLKQQAGRLSTPGVAMHGPIGDSGPMAFFDCPRGHRVGPETRVFQARARHGRLILPLESSVSRSRWPPPGNGSQGWNGLSARDAQAACGFK